MKPSDMVAVFKQVLDQHYSLVDSVNAIREQLAGTKSKPNGPPPGSGPSDTMLLGLRVAPVDVSTLADGTKLTFSKKDGNFQFK